VNPRAFRSVRSWSILLNDINVRNFNSAQRDFALFRLGSQACNLVSVVFENPLGVGDDVTRQCNQPPLLCSQRRDVVAFAFPFHCVDERFVSVHQFMYAFIRKRRRGIDEGADIRATLKGRRRFSQGLCNVGLMPDEFACAKNLAGLVSQQVPESKDVLGRG
jgi:hypothetical protein